MTFCDPFTKTVESLQSMVVTKPYWVMWVSPFLASRMLSARSGPMVCEPVNAAIPAVTRTPTSMGRPAETRTCFISRS
ncbi:Uncharacterised protein [Mycobacteroides abscessus subsp. abscessus]|nr:Uncharacterised protein [Mycobacteroides abscessus subsp. abscessus]